MKPIHKYVLVGALASLLAIVAPVVLFNALDMPNVAGIASLAGVATFVTGLLTSLRGAVLSVAVFAAGSALAVAASGNAWLSALLMAVAAGALGMSAYWGLNKSINMVPIALGFVVTSPPPSGSSQWPAWLVTGAICLLFGAWALLVLVGARKFLPKLPTFPRLSVGRARLFALTLALMVALATWCAVHFNMGHPGGWLILTIFIVFQPFIQDSYLKSVHRAGGTLLGFVVVFAVGSVTTSVVLIYAVGSVCVVLAMYALLLNWPYWQYATFLTATIVFFEGAGSNVLALDVERLVATVTGVVFSLAMIAILYPFAKRLSVKRGETHF